MTPDTFYQQYGTAALFTQTLMNVGERLFPTFEEALHALREESVCEDMFQRHWVHDAKHFGDVWFHGDYSKVESCLRDLFKLRAELFPKT